MIARPVLPEDKAFFNKLEDKLVSASLTAIQGSYLPDYFPSAMTSLLNQLSGANKWVRAFEVNGRVIGFLAAFTSKHQNTGTIARPFVSDDDLQLLPSMLHEASAWLLSLEKSALQIAVPEERTKLISTLEENGWNKVQSWIRLKKELVQ